MVFIYIMHVKEKYTSETGFVDYQKEISECRLSKRERQKNRSQKIK